MRVVGVAIECTRLAGCHRGYQAPNEAWRSMPNKAMETDAKRTRGSSPSRSAWGCACGSSAYGSKDNCRCRLSRIREIYPKVFIELHFGL
jgi:hypothetical protein